MSVEPSSSNAFFRRASFGGLAICATVLITTLAAVSYQSAYAVVGTGYNIGEELDVAREWNGTEPDTLVFFLRSDCLASAEVARNLANRFSAGALSAPVRVVVSDAFRDRETAFATAAGFDLSAIHFTDFGHLKLQLVPSLVVVDREGRVTFERAGLPAVAEALAQFDSKPGT